MRQSLERDTPAVVNRFQPELSYGRHFSPAHWDVRQAAVLFLLYPAEGAWHVPLTLRPRHLAVHAGQVSFPGGRAERGETPEACAWREWNEELGPPGMEFQWLGRLPPLHVYNSNFQVTCCVAAAPHRPEMLGNPDEVELVLEPTLGQLAAEQAYGEHWIQRGGVSFRAPHIAYDAHAIWGATAILIGEFLARLEQAS